MRVKIGFALAAVVMAALAARGLADEKGDALLRAAFGKLRAAKSFSAKVEQKLVTPQGERSFRGTVLAMKPNFFRFELESPGAAPTASEGGATRSTVSPGSGAPMYVSDGKNYFMYQSGLPNYQKMPIEPEPKQMMGPWEGEVDAFFGGADAGEKTQATVSGTDKVNGVDCQLLTVKMNAPPRTVEYAIGKRNLLIHRAVTRIPRPDGSEFVQTNTLTNIKLNSVRSASLFAFKPPAGVTEFVRQDPAAKLIAVGKKAPEFSLPTPDGGKISLQDGLSRKKALLVNFWFYN